MSQFMLLYLVSFRQNFVRDIILYFCLKTDSSRSVVWRPREIPERSCFRVVSRKSGMYRYSYRIHGRCFRYKGLFPHPSPFCPPPPAPPSLVARRTTVSKPGYPRSFRTPSSSSWFRLSWKRRKPAPKSLCADPATRISDAVSVRAFITKFAGNCWKGIKGEKAGKRKSWFAGKKRIGEEKDKGK